MPGRFAPTSAGWGGRAPPPVLERDRQRAETDAALDKTTAALAEVQALKARLEEEVVYLKDEIGRAALTRSRQQPGAALTLHRVEQVAPLSTTVIEGKRASAGTDRARRSRAQPRTRPARW